MMNLHGKMGKLRGKVFVGAPPESPRLIWIGGGAEIDSATNWNRTYSKADFTGGSLILVPTAWASRAIRSCSKRRFKSKTLL
jgi:hypothetical protein